MPAPSHRLSILVSAVLLLLATAVALPAEEAPRSQSQFDFWIGEWDVNLRMKQQDGTWQDRVQAVDKVVPILGGKAILELWDSELIKGYSVRYFDTEKKRWVLWLDWPRPNRTNSGGLEGTFRHGRGEFFSDDTLPDGTPIRSRYTFSDITADRLRWDDAYSRDEGKTWGENWIMEFQRRSATAEIVDGEGKAHTFHTGERCTEPAFHRFDGLAGERSGTVSLRQGDAWKELPATLVGHRILDGCAVMTTLAFQRDGAPYEEHRLQIWNNNEEQFEEAYLDSRPQTSLEIYRGAAGEGALALERTDLHAAAAGGRRHVWNLEGGSVALLVEEADAAGAWTPQMKAVFE